MTETNSTVCAGTPGVSDTFASALWALDYSLLIAQQGIVSADFMGGTNAAGCDPYTPLCPTTGGLAARPIYYGMLATELVGTGRFAALDNPDAAGARAYAVRDGHRLTVVLDDVQDPATNGATTVMLDLGGDFRSGRLSQLPTTIQNARSLLHPGQWFLDQASHTLYLDPLDGAAPATLDVELPRLETLVQGAGSLAQPVHDLTFSGLTFSYATWNAPSGPTGFADVQSNLHMTGANNQGMCNFSSPAGTCPWGLLTEPHANVSFTAADHVTLTGNTFTQLGGAGLSIAYGSSDNLVQGNEFTDIASTSILLGCTADPTPVNPDPAHFPDYLNTNPDTAQTIKDNCTPDPAAVAADKIGTNEIDTGNTISDNVITHVGTDYPSASGITLLFNRGTVVTHNELYDLPYSGITAGVIQGHIDSAATPITRSTSTPITRSATTLSTTTCRCSGTAAGSTWRATRPPTSTRPTARRSTSTRPWRTACK